MKKKTYHNPIGIGCTMLNRKLWYFQFMFVIVGNTIEKKKIMAKLNSYT